MQNDGTSVIALSFSHGAVINVSCAVSRTTVIDWISIIKDLLIGYEIEVFRQRAKWEITAFWNHCFSNVFSKLRYLLECCEASNSTIFSRWIITSGRS